MIKLLKYFRWWYWLILLIITGFVYIQVTLDLTLPEYMGKIIESIMQGVITGVDQTSTIINIGLTMVLIILGSVLCTFIVSYFAARIGAGFSKRIREKLYDKVNDFSLNEINKFSTASLITRSTNDVQQVQMVVIMVLRMAISAPLMAIKGIIKIWGLNLDLTISVAIAVFALVISISIIFILVGPKFKKIQGLVDDLNLVTRENLTGLRVVRANNAEKIQKEKFQEVNDELTSTNLFVHRTMGMMMPTMQLIMSAVNLTIVWLGASLINGGNGALGANNIDDLSLITQFTTYATQIINSFLMVTMMLIMIPRSAVSGKRINEVLDTKVSIKDSETIIKFDTKLKGAVEFRNVSFKYPGAEEYVIDDINFRINPGETVAIIGSTGSGKTTLINLITRFYDVTRGEVLVNGINVKDYKLKDLYDVLGYVPQQGLLFSGTISSNIKFGKENASKEEVDEAIAISQAEEFVSQMELITESLISQGGKNVSGGQKQRLAIARVVVKKPDIYIFDDSFSALDYKTDRNLRKALNDVTNKATKLIVAQRIGTILDANKIIVLEQGKIVGIGTHDELMKSSNVYQEIANSQLSKEELSYGK